MAEYKIEYTNKTDKLVKITEQEALNRQMLHDDFTPTGGVMTFIDPIPKSAEELVVEAVEQETAQANDQALVAYQNYGNLSLAQKDIILKALLGDFISRNRDRYIS